MKRKFNKNSNRWTVFQEKERKKYDYVDAMLDDVIRKQNETQTTLCRTTLQLSRQLSLRFNHQQRVSWWRKWKQDLHKLNPARNYLFKLNNWNTRERYEIQRHQSDVNYVVVVSLLLTLKNVILYLHFWCLYCWIWTKI